MGKYDLVIGLGALAAVGVGAFLFMTPQGREILRDIERAYYKSHGGTPIPGIDIPPYTYKP